MLLTGIEGPGATQRMQVAVGVETQLRRPVITVGQLLAGIAQGLEMPDGIGVLKCRHQKRPLPLLPAWQEFRLSVSALTSDP